MLDDLTPQQIDTLLFAATAAPRMHDTQQPWQFAVYGSVIDVFLDSADPVSKAMGIAAGASVFNLRVAGAHLGFDSWYGLTPNPDEPDVAARIVLRPTRQADPVLACLHGWISERHPGRRPGTAGPVSERCRITLAAAAYTEGAELTWLSETAVVLSTPRDTVADSIVAGMALQRVLLVAGTSGLRAALLDQPVEYDAGLVIGFANGETGTRRRTVRDVRAFDGPDNPDDQGKSG